MEKELEILKKRVDFLEAVLSQSGLYLGREQFNGLWIDWEKKQGLFRGNQ